MVLVLRRLLRLLLCLEWGQEMRIASAGNGFLPMKIARVAFQKNSTTRGKPSVWAACWEKRASPRDWHCWRFLPREERFPGLCSVPPCCFLAFQANSPFFLEAARTCMLPLGFLALLASSAFTHDTFHSFHTSMRHEYACHPSRVEGCLEASSTLLFQFKFQHMSIVFDSNNQSFRVSLKKSATIQRLRPRWRNEGLVPRSTLLLWQIAQTWYHYRLERWKANIQHIIIVKERTKMIINY